MGAPPPAGYAGPPPETPLVSCVLLARGSPSLLARALSSFAAQDYPRRELLVVADGRDEAPDLAPGGPAVTHVRVEGAVAPDRMRAAALGCAAGAIVAEWDERAWSPAWRLSHQVGGLLASGREVSGAHSLLVQTHDGSAAWQRDFGTALAGATLCCTRRVWEQGTVTEPPGADAFAWAPTAWPHVAVAGEVCVLAAPYGSDQPSGPGVQILEHPAAAPAVAPVAVTLPPPAAAPAAPAPPLVSCIMPTFNRPRFAVRAVAYFLAQDYPNRELVVVDDGTDSLEPHLPADERIRYVRPDSRATIGAKRNLACEQARGQIVVQWDDDDWYGPARVRRQVADIIDGRADLTGIVHSFLLDLRTTTFWACRNDTGDVAHPPDSPISGSTLAFGRELWERVGGYPNLSIGEDMGFLYEVVERGGRALGLGNGGDYVYVRHGANSWRFDFGVAEGPSGWTRVDPPAFVPAADLAAYRALRDAAPDA